MLIRKVSNLPATHMWQSINPTLILDITFILIRDSPSTFWILGSIRYHTISGISCNVYGFDSEEKITNIYPLYISPAIYETSVHLLLITKNEQRHYILIKSIDAFLKIKTKYNKKRPTCIKCLQSFATKKVLENHWRSCSSESCQTTKMPEDLEMKFRNFKYRQPNAITIYAGIGISHITLTFTLNLFTYIMFFDLLTIYFTRPIEVELL